MEIDFKKIGRNVKLARNNRGLTQEILADRIDVSLNHISNIENGWTKPSVTTLIKISRALSVPTDEILLDKQINDLECKLAALFADCSDEEQAILFQMALSLKPVVKNLKYADEDK